MLSIIAAIGKNRELGKQQKLLWNIPEDMEWFREKTKGKPVIMGRRTFLSIGHPLPNRKNIVLTNDTTFTHPDVTIARSLPKAIDIAKKEQTDEIFVIGGANVYAQALPLADKLYITVVDQTFDADTFFPAYEERFTQVLFQKTIPTAFGYTITFTILTPGEK